MGAELLDRLERYYDTVPRVAARSYPVGPFTVFVGEWGWPYFARPSLGIDTAVTAADVVRAVRWQTGRGQPGAFEWVEQTTPSMAAAARAPVWSLTGIRCSSATDRWPRRRCRGSGCAR